MMTLAQFHATHSRPDAIMVPGRVVRQLMKRRSDLGIAIYPEAATPAQSVDAAHLLRRLRGDGPRGKKN